jgi:hypothetical protein
MKRFDLDFFTKWQIVSWALLLYLLGADLVSESFLSKNVKIAYLVIIFLFFSKIRTNFRILINVFSSNLRGCLAFIVIVLLNFLFSYDQTNSFFWILQLLMALGILVVFYSSRYDLKINKVMNIFLLLITATVFYQYFSTQLGSVPIGSLQVHSGFYRYGGFSFYPNFFCVNLFLGLPFLIWSKSNRVWLIILFAIAVTFLSGAKTGWFCLLATIILSFFYLSKTKLIKKILMVFIFSISCMFIPERVVQNNQIGNRSEFLYKKLITPAHELTLISDNSLLSRSSVPERKMIAIQGVKVALDYPFLGVGAGAYKKFIENLSNDKAKRYFVGSLIGRLYGHHENIWIESMSCMGFIFTFVVMFVVSKFILMGLKSNNENLRKLSGTLAIYYFVSGMFVQNILFPPVFAIWGLYFKESFSTLDSSKVLPATQD